jgi:hypothetical protein
MTRTARRRWSREFQGEIDGIALGEEGPVFLHGYDPPAGGKWIDSVIPGKLAAHDRSTGNELWVSPCEVGYGRGFGSGLGNEDDVVVLGPSLAGHRIARMSRGTGELIGISEIKAFDQALVFGDMSFTVSSSSIAGIMTSPMLEVWTYGRDSERYHLAGRAGSRLLVAYTNTNLRRQGVLALDAESGDFTGAFLPAEYPVIHDMVAHGNLCALLTGNRVPGRRAGGHEELYLVVFGTEGDEARPLWRESVSNESFDELPDVSIFVDSGKIYVAHGALLDVRDGISGRSLGELTLPGLDERVAFQVSQGAGLVAEETRASVFELPA